MTLQEWTIEMYESLAAFTSNWKLQHTKKPGVYPLDMESGDWDEQFMLCHKQTHVALPKYDSHGILL